ncbi:hyaluronidase Tab y 2.0101 [Culex quinquefasciatus]|uniref:hyaluronidase Tab y 2.0101 n=1 Tax=Culex quinquefasciatus TaxID=7176 RepID=UPI0018E37240|nr:hyaluronidase Tab y 2.0101 [Culex quinquefasciatus]
MFTTNRCHLLVVLICLGGTNCKPFKVYWNIPTYLCKSYGVDFTDVTSKYGIIQNEKDAFRGEKIAILYEPGHFPALVNKSDGMEEHYGGVPQKGDVEDHLKAFEEVLNKQVLKDFAGVGVIDFEMWRPIYRHNFGLLKVYKNYSEELVKKEHADYSSKVLEEEAAKQYEPAAREFMSRTLALAKKLRPGASWGYYAFPYCFNINGAKDGKEDCAKQIQDENDQLQSWLFNEVKIIFPAVYLQTNLDLENRTKLVGGRVKEAVRVAKLTKADPLPKVLTYMRFVYTDNISKLLEKADWTKILPAMKDNGSDGIILWGSSEDVNTKDNCEKFKKYIDDILGPILKSIQK